MPDAAVISRRPKFRPIIKRGGCRRCAYPRVLMSNASMAVLLSVLAACGSSSGDVDEFTRADGAPDVLPTHLEFALITEQSRSDPGWTGGAHGSGPPGGSVSMSEIVECDEDGRRCRFRGPVRGDEPVVNQRCLGNTALECETDDDCGDTGPCRFMFPPFAGNDVTPICSEAYFEPTGADDPSPSMGVFDFATGDIDYTTLNIHVGISLTGNCVDCLGDAQPRDGNKDGHCGDSEVACDVHGTTTDPPGSPSFDCGPHDFRSLDLPIPASGASTTPTSWTLDDSRPHCTVSPFTALECWCGVCEDTATPCASDAECGEGGSCGWPGEDAGNPTYRTAPDSCEGTCDWDEETSVGTCDNADGVEVGCLPRSGTVEVQGGAEVLDGYYVSTIGLLTCMPASGSALLDGIAGFPGPLVYQSSYRVTPVVR